MTLRSLRAPCQPSSQMVHVGAGGWIGSANASRIGGGCGMVARDGCRRARGRAERPDRDRCATGWGGRARAWSAARPTYDGRTGTRAWSPGRMRRLAPSSSSAMCWPWLVRVARPFPATSWSRRSTPPRLVPSWARTKASPVCCLHETLAKDDDAAGSSWLGYGIPIGRRGRRWVHWSLSMVDWAIRHNPHAVAGVCLDLATSRLG